MKSNKNLYLILKTHKNIYFHLEIIMFTRNILKKYLDYFVDPQKTNKKE